MDGHGDGVLVGHALHLHDVEVEGGVLRPAEVAVEGDHVRGQVEAVDDDGLRYVAEEDLHDVVVVVVVGDVRRGREVDGLLRRVDAGARPPKVVDAAIHP